LSCRRENGAVTAVDHLITAADVELAAMPTAAVKPTAPARWPETLTILGTEMLLLGWLAAVIAWRVGPSGVLGMCGALLGIAGMLSTSFANSFWRSVTRAILALCLSFVSMLPGVFFFLEILSRGGGHCSERSWFGASSSMLAFGPVLVVASTLVSPWRLTAIPMTALRALHALVWLAGACHTLLCAMMI
jgi:hypothetical protein